LVNYFKEGIFMANYAITYKPEKGSGTSTSYISANSVAEARAKFNAPAKHVIIVSVYKK
jgi:hypothetical protein